MNIARIVVSIVVALLLIVTGGGKVLRLPFSRANRDVLGVSPTFWIVTGALELAAVVGLVWGIWFPPFGIAAAIGVALLMIGAIVFRFRAADAGARRGFVADVVLFLIAVAIIVLTIPCLEG
jgi:hypothetical protein